jgi:flagellar basal body-associated protein FliL
MSDDKKAKPANASGGVGLGVLAMVLPSIFAAAASFGAARATATPPGPPMQPAAPASPEEPTSPGPTLALDPFLVAVQDAKKKMHPMKVNVAVEFGPKASPEELKVFTPRLRDAALDYLRRLTFEEAMDPQVNEKIRPEMLEKLRAAGLGAKRVLITDLVVQ